MDIILASKSPRRRKLLGKAGVDFRTMDSQASEQLPAEAWNNPEEAVKTLAERKAGTIVQVLIAAPENMHGPTMVIGADTIVVLNGKVFGKPVGADDAKRMLRELAGQQHQVITGVSVWAIDRNSEGKFSIGNATFAETSSVYFKELTDEEIKAYLAEGESFDKAGAYAIQGKGKRLVDHYEGDWDNIVGLPVTTLLKRFPQLRERDE